MTSFGNDRFAADNDFAHRGACSTKHDAGKQVIRGRAGD